MATIKGDAGIDFGNGAVNQPNSICAMAAFVRDSSLQRVPRGYQMAASSLHIRLVRDCAGNSHHTEQHDGRENGSCFHSGFSFFGVQNLGRAISEASLNYYSGEEPRNEHCGFAA
jgi:hypothetical protein